MSNANPSELDPDTQEVINGLSSPEKTLPCKWLYDEHGSKLFDQITELEAYYPTRTEVGILSSKMDEIVSFVPEHTALVEIGSGSSTKTTLLLDAMPNLAAYVPIDISGEHLETTARRLRARYPELPVVPVVADYTQPVTLPDLPEHEHNFAFFPGSTIGNFDADEAVAFLRRIRNMVGDAGGLIIGVDLQKDIGRLLRAYDDEEGVTAEFNLNLLSHLNAALDADFDIEAFEHRSVWNDALHCIEMHVVSKRAQTVTVAGVRFDIAEGEPIRTERSHKYTLERFAAAARDAGFATEHVWTDDEQLFSVHLLASV